MASRPATIMPMSASVMYPPPASWRTWPARPASRREVVHRRPPPRLVSAGPARSGPRRTAARRAPAGELLSLEYVWPLHPSSPQLTQGVETRQRSLGLSLKALRTPGSTCRYLYVARGQQTSGEMQAGQPRRNLICLLYTSDAADEED